MAFNAIPGFEVFRRHDPGILAAAAAGVAGTDDELPLLPEERTA